MAGRTLGSAWISVQPAGFATFGTKTAAGVKAATRGVQGTVPISPDVKGFGPAIAKLRAELAALGKSHAGGVFDLVDLNASPAQIMSQLRLLKRMIGQAGVSDLISANLNTSQIEEQLAKLKRLTDLSVGVDTTDAVTSVEELRARVGALTSNLGDLRIGADTTEAAAAIARLQAQAAALGKRVNRETFGADTSQLVSAEARLLAVQAAYERLVPAEQDAQKSTGLFNDAISKGLPLVSGFGKGFYGLGGEIQLFGGILTKVGAPAILGAVTGVHLLADAATEAAAVLVPAGVAFGSFALAAAPAIQQVYQQEKALYTVSQALGVQMPGLSGNFAKVADAVRPQVYVLMGEALDTLNKNTGTFARLATGAGSVLDQLGARIELALGSKGASGFAEKAVSDLQGLGNVIGNVFGIFGNLLKSMPGTAEMLLKALQGVTGALEAITASGAVQGLLNIGLALHGAVLWGGLAATAMFALKTPLLGIAGWVSGAANAVVKFGLMFTAVAAEEGVLAAATATLEGVMAALAAVNPFVWVALGVAALTGLAVWLANTRTAAQQFYDTVNRNADAATSFSQVTSALQDGLKGANDALGSTQKYVAGMPGIMGRFGGAVSSQVNPALGQWHDTVSKLNGEIQLQGSRLSELDKITGSTANTQADLQAIGVKNLNLASLTAGQYKILVTEVRAYADATTQLAGYTGGEALAAQQALTNEYMQQTLPAIQKVTDAEDAMIKLITGGRSAFDAFELGQSVLAENLRSTTGLTGNASQSLDGLKSKFSLVGAAMGGTSEASYKLNQAFYDQVGNARQVITALQQQSISQGDLSKVVATAAEQLLGYAGNNQAARSTIVDLINSALGPGTTSLKGLNQWVGTNSVSLGAMNKIVDQSTVKVGNLTGALSATLTQMQAVAIFQAHGGQAAWNTFTTDIETGKTANQQFQVASQDVADQLLASSNNSIPAAKRAFIQFAEQGLGLTKSQADSLWQRDLPGLQGEINKLHGTTVTIQAIARGSGNVSVTASGLAAKEIAISNRAAGGFISGGTPGQDSVAAMLMPGEVVVPTAMVKAGAVDHLRGMLPGFAGGGFVGLEGKLGGYPGAVSRAYGSDVQAIYAADLKAVLQAQVNAERAALQAAAARNAGVGLGIAASPARTGSIAVEQAFARSILWAYGWGQNQMPPLIALWNQESGWNPYAVNPASGAYGIPQSLGHGHPYNLGDYQAQIRWGLSYIKATYGSPAAAEAHELAYHWYKDGGLVGMASGGKASKPPVPPTRGGKGSKPPVSPVAYKAFLASLKHTQGLEYRDWAGLWWSFLKGPRKYLTPATLTALRIAEKDEYAEQLAVAAILKHSTGSVADINAQPGLVAKLHSAVAKEQAALRPKILSRLPGGHPGFVRGELSRLAALAGLSAPGKAALQSWVPGNLGLSHHVGGGVLTFDRGGQWPSGTLGWNGSGKTETVIPGGASAGPSHVTVIVENHGVLGGQAEVRNWLQREMNLLARTGRMTQAVRVAQGRAS